MYCVDGKRACVTELQKLWRSVAVEGVDEKKMEEYLQKHGFTSMQDTNVKPAVTLQLEPHVSPDCCSLSCP